MSAINPASNVPQQQYAPNAAQFPYYGNPYYNQQHAAAYYYGGPQYYPNQGGRGMFQPQRGPYPDPYGNNGSLYPGDVYGQGGHGPGGFNDAPSSYGGTMPNLHQGQGGIGAIGGGVGGGSGNGGNNSKSSKGGNNSQSVGGGSAQQGGMGHGMQEHSNLNSNYGYLNNPYNARGVGIDQASWGQYQQNHPSGGGWGMMGGFAPSASPTGAAGQNHGQNQGFGNQGQHQGMNGVGMNPNNNSQQQQQQQGGRGGNDSRGTAGQNIGSNQYSHHSHSFGSGRGGSSAGQGNNNNNNNTNGMIQGGGGW